MPSRSPRTERAWSAALLRKAADQAGLTEGLSSAFRQKNASPLLDRGAVLVSMAAAIALGAAGMSDIALLAHLAPVLGAALSGPTVRRALGLAGGTAMLERAAKAREEPALTCGNSSAARPPRARRRRDGRRRDRQGHGTAEPASKTWQVNTGWVLAANIAGDLTAWTRLLGLHGCDGLKDAEPDTLRYRIWRIPTRLARHARQRILKISPDWPWTDAFVTCWQRLCTLPAPS
jgi:hypothetical protein